MEPITTPIARQMSPAHVHEDIQIMQQIVDEVLKTRSAERTTLFLHQVCHRELDVRTTIKFVLILLHAGILSEEIVPRIALYNALRTGALQEARDMLSLFQTNEEKQGFINYVLEQSIEFGLDYSVLINLKMVHFFHQFSPNKAFVERALDLSLCRQDYQLIHDLVVLPYHPPENVALIQTFLTLYSTRHESFPILMRFYDTPAPTPLAGHNLSEKGHQPFTFEDVSNGLLDMPLFPSLEKTAEHRLAEAFETKNYQKIWDCLTDEVTNVEVIDTAGMSLVHWAIKQCHIRLTIKLIRKGASISHFIFPSYHEDFIRFIDSFTRLPRVQKDLPKLLLEESRVECVAFFTELGLKNRPSNPKVDSLLNDAIKHGFVKLARYLVNANEIQNYPGRIVEPTRDILNLDLNDPEILNLCRLIAQKCDFIYRRYGGTTLLHLAIQKNKWKWIQFLANRSTVHAEDQLGRTPLQVALMLSNTKATVLFESLMAD